MADKNTLFIIKSSRGAYLQRLAILNDRDKKLYPFILAYETKIRNDALKFDYEITAQAIADFLSDSRDDSYYLEKL